MLRDIEILARPAETSGTRAFRFSVYPKTPGTIWLLCFDADERCIERLGPFTSTARGAVPSGTVTTRTAGDADGTSPPTGSWHVHVYET